jgi:hypothetical protein
MKNITVQIFFEKIDESFYAKNGIKWHGFYAILKTEIFL